VCVWSKRTNKIGLTAETRASKKGAKHKKRGGEMQEGARGDKPGGRFRFQERRLSSTGYGKRGLEEGREGGGPGKNQGNQPGREGKAPGGKGKKISAGSF